MESGFLDILNSARPTWLFDANIVFIIPALLNLQRGITQP